MVALSFSVIKPISAIVTIEVSSRKFYQSEFMLVLWLHTKNGKSSAWSLMILSGRINNGWCMLGNFAVASKSF